MHGQRAQAHTCGGPRHSRIVVICSQALAGGFYWREQAQTPSGARSTSSMRLPTHPVAVARTHTRDPCSMALVAFRAAGLYCMLSQPTPDGVLHRSPAEHERRIYIYIFFSPAETRACARTVMLAMTTLARIPPVFTGGNSTFLLLVDTFPFLCILCVSSVDHGCVTMPLGICRPRSLVAATGGEVHLGFWFAARVWKRPDVLHGHRGVIVYLLVSQLGSVFRCVV